VGVTCITTHTGALAALFIVEAPLVLGHEVSGVIDAVGADVKNLQVGQRVALEPGYPCRHCTYCKTGHYNLCPSMTFMATPPVDGALSEYVIWPEDFTFPVPDSISDDAALLEPLAVGIWSARRGGVKSGDAVAIGAGPIGCTSIQAARLAGATTVIAVDLEEFRLELARTVGATHTINASSQDAVAEIRRITHELSGLPMTHAGVDVAFETAGSIPTCRMSLAAPRPGGVTVLVGLPPVPEVSLDIVSAASRETDIRGIFRYANCYPTAIALVACGAVDLDALVTHRYTFADTQTALEFADCDKKTSMKVMIDVG
jgi:L-iditol 2-dehydrogenase